MRFSYQNQFEPFVTETTHVFEAAQDWTRHGVTRLTLSFRGQEENVEQPMYIRVEDAGGVTATVMHPLTYAVQTEYWRRWNIDLAELSGAGIDLTAIAKLTIGMGDGTASIQVKDDLDTIYIDHIRICPPESGDGQQ